MAISIGGIGQQLGSIVLQLGKWGVYLAFLIVILIAVGWWAIQRRRWNIKVEFKFPRSGGGFLFSEHGKGMFNAKAGYTLLKRPGVSGAVYKIEQFDPKIYLQGTDTLTVVQTGPLSFMPVIQESYDTVVDENGNEAIIMHFRGDISKDLQWATNAHISHLNAYTIKNFLKDNAQWIGIGFIVAIVLLSQYIGIGIVVDKLKGA